MSMDHSKTREGCILWKLKTRRSYVQYLTVSMLAFPAKGDAGSMFQSIMDGIITWMSLHKSR